MLFHFVSGGSRWIRAPLCLAIALFGVSPAIADQAERQVWDLGTLQPGRVYDTEATGVNHSCRGKHDLEITVEGAPWLRITGPHVLRRVGVGERKSTPAQVDTRGLEPGVYRGEMRIRCLTCPPPPKCVQSITELDVVFRIPTLEERFDPVPGGSLPPTATLCGVQSVEGRFEPTQGVWQDDPVFADRDGKQLRQLNPRLFQAELDMVVARPSTLFGTIRPAGGAPEARRQEIFLRGTTDGTQLVPVRIQVTLFQGGKGAVVWTSSEAATIPIGPPCRPGTATPFEVAADVGTGAGDFQFGSVGYLLEAELILDNGAGTGLKARVLGSAKETHAPSVLFRPIYVTPLAADAAEALTQTTQELEQRSAREIPDWFPLRAASLGTRTLDARSFAPALRDREAVQEVRRRFRPADAGALGRLVLRQAILRQLQTSALYEGFDRVLVALNFGDFNRLRTGPVKRAVAFTNSPKVSFIDIDTAPFPWTVAHELSHTLPFPWTSEEVTAECGVDFHDKLGSEGHGLQIRRAGEASRSRQDGVIPVFAQATRARPWITQCTYWHHLKTLVEGPPDPPVILVQGYVGREEEVAGAALLPAYQLDSVPDLEAGDAKAAADAWAIELLAPDDSVLARFPFEPNWTFADTGESDPVVAFAHRVPDPGGVAGLRVTGPGGANDTLRYSAHPPTLEITEPPPGAANLPADGSLSLAWRGFDADGDDLVYSVFHSEDGGENWADVAFEISETSLDLQVDPSAGPHALRVVVTDGAQSTERRLELASP